MFKNWRGARPTTPPAVDRGKVELEAKVAAEVRSLAHQSAASARDITRFVAESRERMATLSQSLARLDKSEGAEKAQAA